MKFVWFTCFLNVSDTQICVFYSATEQELQRHDVAIKKKIHNSYLSTRPRCTADKVVMPNKKNSCVSDNMPKILRVGK